MAARVVVTGSSGFVGGSLIASLVRAGHSVVSAGRRRPRVDCEHHYFDLCADMPPHMLRGADVVFHCAYDLRLRGHEEIREVNIRGTERLATAAARSDVRTVLISSMSAYPNTTQLYGRAKLECEAAVLARGGNVVRLGLVWGGASGGMIETLTRLSSLPVIPVLGTDPYQYTVHAEDMASALTVLASVAAPACPIGLANPERVPFRRIMTALAGSSSPPRFVALPWQPVYFGLRALERIKLPLPVRADSLLGLVRAASEVPHSEYWSEHRITLRRFPG